MSYFLFCTDVKQAIPRPVVTEFERPTTPVAVAPADMIHHKNVIDALNFEMETIVSVTYKIKEINAKKPLS